MFLNVYKPRGVTSRTMLGQLARAITRKQGFPVKAGFVGTLDPMAEGVLPVALQSATRSISLLPASRKIYVARVVLGLGTASDDLDCDAFEVHDASCASESSLRAALASVAASPVQRPPAFSAIWVSGVRAHALARRNSPVVQDLPTRPCRIRELRMLGGLHPLSEATRAAAAESAHGRALTTALASDAGAAARLREFELHVECDEGTYIRAIARDVGLALGTRGCVAALRRCERSGFVVAESTPLAELVNSGPEAVERFGISVERVFERLGIPAVGLVQVPGKPASRLVNGLPTWVSPMTGFDFSSPEATPSSPARKSGQSGVLARVYRSPDARDFLGLARVGPSGDEGPGRGLLAQRAWMIDDQEEENSHR